MLCIFLKKYLRGDGKRKQAEKYLEKIKCEKRDIRKCGRQLRPAIHRTNSFSEKGFI